MKFPPVFGSRWRGPVPMAIYCDISIWRLQSGSKLAGRKSASSILSVVDITEMDVPKVNELSSLCIERQKYYTNHKIHGISHGSSFTCTPIFSLFQCQFITVFAWL